MLAVLDNEALLEHYLDLCAQALARYAEEFPFKHLLRAAERMTDRRCIAVEIYETTPEDSLGTWGVALDEAQRPSVVTCENPKGTWRVKRRHLEQAIENPAPFLDNPVHLDWGWLKLWLEL